MKCFVILVLLVCHFSCSTIKQDRLYKILKAPPGTVRLNDSLFIDKTEIANVHWREFVYALLVRDKDTAKTIKNLPDTSLYTFISCNTTKPVTNYYSLPAYNYYPVAGITYEQAVAFCEWRSKMVNRLYQLDPTLNPIKGKKYHYRLPTIEEWESAAGKFSNINASPYGYNSIKESYVMICDGEKKYRVNQVDNYVQNTKYTFNKKNITDLYNMIGNVSEITATKGIAKGGNFLLPLDSCTVKGYQTYTKPQVWLGFRCVCEIVNE